MPAAIASAITSTLAGTSLVGAIGIGGISFLSHVITNVIVGFVVNKVVGSFTKKPQEQNWGAFARDRTLTIREPVSARRVIYGQARVGGTLAFIHSTDSNQYLHLVIVLAGHECQEIGNIYFNDEIVPLSSGAATGTYAGYAWINKHLGTGAQTADSDLISAAPSKWTSSHRLRGRAYKYAKLKYSQDLFASGVPNVSAVVKGKKVYDPRTATTVWTNNPALIISDYLTDSTHGMGADYSTEIDETELTASANICDEQVTLTQTNTTFTANSDSPTTDVLTLAEDMQFGLGDVVQLTNSASPATLPGGLAESTDYYYIPLTTTTFSLATTLANARAGTAIDITSAGTGTHTVTRQSQLRYTCNGVIDTSMKPKDILEALNSSKAGPTIWSQGTWKIKAGAYETPTLSLDEDDLRDSIKVLPRLSRRDSFNAVKGIYVSPANQWQPADFPVITNATYLSQDNDERIWRDLDLPFTTASAEAQRLGKIVLERARQQITFNAPCKLTALRAIAGGTVNWTIDRFGWTSKAFEVQNFQFVVFNDDQGAPALGVDLLLRETASTVYDWSSGEETSVDPAPDTDLPDPFTVPAPTSLSVSSEQILTGTGDETFRVFVEWVSPDDFFVTNNGRIEVQWKESADSTWRPSWYVEGSQTSAQIYQLEKGVNYDVRVRGVNNIGVRSSWSTLYNFTVTSPGGATTLLDYGEFSDSITEYLDYDEFSASVTANLDYGEFA